MIELGQLEAAHAEFDKRRTRVVVASLEDQPTAQATQADFPHLVVVADAERNLAEAVQVIHEQSAPGGGDTTAPTTLLIDGGGTVRWLFRPDRFLTRLDPTQVLAAIDQHLPASKISGQSK
jgi:peroxiredoxin